MLGAITLQPKPERVTVRDSQFNFNIGNSLISGSPALLSLVWLIGLSQSAELLIGGGFSRDTAWPIFLHGFWVFRQEAVTPILAISGKKI